MINSLKFEFKNCINSREARLAIILMMTLTLSASLLSCITFYGFHITQVRSAMEMSFAIGNYSGTFMNAFEMLLPIIAGFIYSSSLLEEKESSGLNYILIRTTYFSHVSVKGIILFIVTFLVISIPLILNALICLTAFPILSYDSTWAIPPYAYTILGNSGDYWLDSFEAVSPYAYEFVKIAIISLTGAVLAVFSYSLSFVSSIAKKNKYMNTLITFAVYTLITIVAGVSYLRVFSLASYVGDGYKGRGGVYLMIVGLLLLVSSSIIIYKGMHHYEDIC